jgi:triacylglycerol lipase
MRLGLGVLAMLLVIGLASAAAIVCVRTRLLADAAAMTNSLRCPLPSCKTPPSPNLVIPPKPAILWPLDTKASYLYHLALMNFEALFIAASHAGSTVVPPPGTNVVAEIATPAYPHLGVVCSSGGASLIVAFRGTQHLDEIFKDLDTRQVAFTPPLTPTSGRAGGSPQVHAGFFSVYQSVRQIMMSSVQASQATSVVFVGHSLGAALAVLGAVSLKLASPLTDVSVVTYACPRVGNLAWADLVDDSVLQVRFENASDEVPTLPPAVVPNTSDSSAPYIYLQSGLVVGFQQNWASTLNNHVIDNYLSWLQQCGTRCQISDASSVRAEWE